MAKPKKRSTRRRSPVEESDSFLFEIEKVHPHYSFGDGSRLDCTAFSEHLHPQFDTNCLAPEKFKGRSTRFLLLGDRADERDLWLRTPAEEWHRGVGTLTFRGQRSEYLGGIPFDALWNVVHAALAGGIRFIYLHGAAMKRGTSRIRWIAFYKEYDMDDV